MRRSLAYAAVSILVCACGTAGVPAPQSPSAPPASEAHRSAPEAPSTGGPSPIAPAPESCAVFLKPSGHCDEGGSLVERLSVALTETDPLSRDQRLQCIEQRSPERALILRALRADLAPIPCADVIVTPALEAGAKGASPEDETLLLGLMLSARLHRAVDAPPSLQAPFDKPHFLEFFEKSLKPWMLAQALAIGELSQAGAKLSGYGKAIAAIEAGLADLRFVQAARRVPLPAELSGDADVKNVYYAALDEALEPRKARGRDAALVGLRYLAELGAVADLRILRARSLLSELYGGSRIDALDRLLLPELPPLVTDTPELALAAKLPPYYASRLFSELARPEEPKLIRAFAEQGLFPALRARLDGSPLSERARTTYAISEARRGTLFFSGTIFRHAAEIAEGGPSGAAGQLVAAAARALENAPKDAIELMLAPPQPRASFGSFAKLDALSAKPGVFQAEASFDSAYLRLLTPPENDPQFWRDLANRFGRAEKSLKEPGARTLARELKESSKKTADVLLKPGTSTEKAR